MEPSAGRGLTIWMSTTYRGEGKQEGGEEMRRGKENYEALEKKG